MKKKTLTAIALGAATVATGMATSVNADTVTVTKEEIGDQTKITTTTKKTEVSQDKIEQDKQAIQDQQKVVDQTKNEMDQAQSTVNADKDKVSDAQNNVDSAKGALDKAQSNKDQATQNNIAQNKQDQQTTQNKINQDQSSISSQEQVIDQNKENMDNAQSDVDQAKQNQQTAQDNYDQAVKDQQQAQNDVNNAQQAINNQQNQVNKDQSQVDQDKQDISNTQNDIKNDQANITQDQQNIDNASQKVKDDQAKLDQDQNKLDQAQQTQQNDQNKVNDTQGQIDKVNDQLSNTVHADMGQALKDYLSSDMTKVPSGSTAQDIWDQQDKYQENLINSIQHTTADNVKIDPTNLTKDQQQEINEFAASVVNDVRTQIGKTTVVPNWNMIDMANQIADEIDSSNYYDSHDFGHATQIINDAAKDQGLVYDESGKANYYEDITGDWDQYSGSTMYDLKVAVVKGILNFMGDKAHFDNVFYDEPNGMLNTLMGISWDKYGNLHYENVNQEYQLKDTTNFEDQNIDLPDVSALQ